MHILHPQSWPKVVGRCELYHVYPIPANQCWEISHFFPQNGKNHLIINTESGGMGELASCLNSFVWDCSLRLSALDNSSNNSQPTQSLDQLPLLTLQIIYFLKDNLELV